MRDLGRECGTVEFVDGMEGLDQAVRSLSAMLNRFNKAEIYIGVGIDGRPAGADLSEEDISRIDERIGQLMNRHPQTLGITLEVSDDGERYIRISATGYETPYAYGSWFYTRKCNPTQPEGPQGRVVEEWTETLTCGMKRHRSHEGDRCLRRGFQRCSAGGHEQLRGRRQVGLRPGQDHDG